MIQFAVETIEEEDNSWSQLIVKTDDKDWHSAELTYGTEDESKIRNILRHGKCCNAVLKNFLDFLKSKNVDLTASPCDYLCDMDSPWGIDFGGVTVTSNEDFRAFEVGYETYDSGSYWEPPSNDYCEHSTHKSLIDALFTAYSIIMKDEYLRFGEKGMDEAYNN